MSKDLAKIRRHFLRETGKLDNWIRHRHVDEYLKVAEELFTEDFFEGHDENLTMATIES